MAKQSKEKYCGQSEEERIDYILNHFGQMEQLLKAKKESLIYVMSNQRAYNRKKNSDDICLRVQTSAVFKSLTEEEAIERYMFDQCIEKGKISRELEADIDSVHEINQAIFDLHVLKNEYYIVVRHVDSLPINTKKIIVPYLKGEKDLQDLADEMCIEKDSVKQRTYRIRKQIKKNVFPYFSNYSTGGTGKKTNKPSYDSNNVEGM